MTRSSCITHSTRQQLVLIRQDYLELCKGDHCAAALLNVFEYWTNVKLSAAEQAKIDNEIAQYEGLEPTQDTELWIYKRVPDFQAELLDLFGEKKVTTGLQFLKDNGFIQTRNNPKYKWDKTLQYLLNTEALNCAIRDRKNAVSKKSKRALNARKNAAAIPEITTEATTEKKKSPKPPKGAVDDSPESQAVTAIIHAWLTHTQTIEPNAYKNKSKRSDALFMHNNGVTPEIIGAWAKSLRRTDFWRDKAITWKKLTGEILPFKDNYKPVPHIVPERPFEPAPERAKPDEIISEEEKAELRQIFEDLVKSKVANG